MNEINKIIHVDQLKREICFQKLPKRIVSLVPSQTELLVSLGLIDRIVGVTKFCIHPKNLKSQKVIVGGTKQVNYDKIEKLDPDIILCNKEENTEDIVKYLENKYPVHVSNINSLSDALEMINQYGDIFEVKDKAQELVSMITLEKKSFDDFISEKPKKRVVYFIWKDPWMTVGNDTFIHTMLQLNGFVNVYKTKTRYPEVGKDDLKMIKDLDLILLSSEPFPFSEKHIAEIKSYYPNTKVVLVDGEYFSWYGSRLVKAFSYFKTLH